MEYALAYIATAVAGYLLGSIPFAVIIASCCRVDILKAGSGNPGATNVKRTCGKIPGNLCFVLDAAKGFAAASFPVWAGYFGLKMADTQILEFVGLASAILTDWQEDPEISAGRISDSQFAAGTDCCWEAGSVRAPISAGEARLSTSESTSLSAPLFFTIKPTVRKRAMKQAAASVLAHKGKKIRLIPGSGSAGTGSPFIPLYK